MEEQAKTMKVVWTVVDRGQGKSFWTRVGVGFVNRDGSMTLRLDAIPMSGNLQVREWEAFDRRSETAETPGRDASGRDGPSRDASGRDGPPRPRTKPLASDESLL